MNREKKILSLALALMMALTLLPATALAAEEDTERGVLTYTEVIAPQYDGAARFSEDLAAVEKDGKWGFIDSEGNTVIPFQYDYAWSFNEGYAVVLKAVGGMEGIPDDEYTSTYSDYTYFMTGELGFIDKDNHYTAFLDPNASYDSDYNLTAGPLRLKFYTYTYIPSGDVYSYLPSEMDLIFHNGVVIIGSGEYGGYSTIYHTDGKGYDIDGSGIGFGSRYTTGPMNEGGLIPVQLSWEYNYAGYVDAYGKLVYEFDQEFFGSAVTDQWGNSNQSFRNTYYVTSFNQGLALAYQGVYDSENWDYSDGKFGFIDRSYNWVISPQFEMYWYHNPSTTQEFFGDTGTAVVSKDGKYGAIDKTGKTVIPFQYEDLMPVNEGRMAFKQGGKWGFLDAATLEVVIPAQYEKVSSFNNGLAVAYDGSKAFIIDWNGVQVPGADKLDPDSYFVEEEDGTRSVFSPGEYVVVEENGKYGFGRIEYLPNLPASDEMSSWAYEDVTAAISAELIPVSLQNLYLNNIKRGEFCSVVMQAITATLDTDVETLVQEKTGSSLASYQKNYPFSDTTSSDVIAAYALGIVAGRGDGLFDPYATITRQEAAAFLTRGANVLGMDTSVEGGSEFNDSSTIDVWAKDSVDFVYQIKVMSGTGNDNFSPLGTYTREQSYSTIYRLYKAVLDQA